MVDSGLMIWIERLLQVVGFHRVVAFSGDHVIHFFVGGVVFQNFELRVLRVLIWRIGWRKLWLAGMFG
jgi:hypothetical protein